MTGRACCPRISASGRWTDVADDWPLTYEELEPFYDRVARDVGVSGLAGDPAYPEGDDLPLPALPLGDGVIDVVRAHDRLGWHWWPAPNAILSAPYRGRHPCAQWGSCMQGCPEGAKASTDITHWPEAIEHGARVITGARVTRVIMGANRLATGAEYIDRAGAAHRLEAGVIVLAANAIGTARLLLMSADDEFPDGLANSSGLVGRRLMMHPFAVVTGVFDQFLQTWKRERRIEDSLSRVLRDRSEPGVRAGRQVEHGAVDGWTDECRHARPGGGRGLGA